MKIRGFRDYRAKDIFSIGPSIKRLFKALTNLLSHSFVTPRRVSNDPSALYAFRLHIPPDAANGLNKVDSLVAMLTYADEPKTSQKKKDVTEIPTGAVGFRERVRGMTLRLLELCDSSSGMVADGK